jgi:hypothetical protein
MESFFNQASISRVVKTVFSSLLLAFNVFHHACAVDNVPGANNALLSAEITITPYVFSFGTHIDELILERVGCKYAAESPDVASRFFDLVASARDTSDQAVAARRNFEARNRIVFHFFDQSSIAVYFDQKFINVPYVDGSWNDAPMLFDGRLVTKVHDLIEKEGLRQRSGNISVSCSW